MRTAAVVSGLILAVILAFSQNAIAQETPARLPVPAAADQNAARKLIDNIYKNDLAKAVTPAQKSETATKLLQVAIETKNDPDGQFGLLAKARECATQAGDVSLAMNVVEETGKLFQIDTLALQDETLAGLTKTVSPKEISALLGACQNVIDGALIDDRFETARRISEIALAAARRINDPDRIKETAAWITEVRQCEQAFSGLKAAFATLVDTPSDPAANLAVGRHYCFIQGQWEKGLPMLAKGSDLGLKALAEKEATSPTDAEKQSELADAWWDMATKERGLAQQKVQQHAASWYRRALPNLAGLAKAKAETRVGELHPKDKSYSNIAQLGEIAGGVLAPFADGETAYSNRKFVWTTVAGLPVSQFVRIPGGGARPCYCQDPHSRSRSCCCY